MVSAILLTAGCNKPEQGDEPGPQPGDAPVIELIELSGNNMTVPAEGGQAVIKYKIVNPVEGGMMSAASTEDWVGEFDCNTDGQVSFTVALNETLEDRNSILTLTYTYGEDEENVNVQVNLIQGAGYKYTLKATSFLGAYYKDTYGNNDEDTYDTWLSDEPWVDEKPTDGGTYYLLSLYLDGDPVDPEHPLPVLGTYTLGEEGRTDDMTMSIDDSHYVTYPVGSEKKTLYFTDGTLTVSQGEGSTLVFDAVLTDTNGDRHHVTYSGNAEYIVADSGDPEPPVDGTPILDHDVTMDGEYIAARYIYGTDDVMEVTMTVSDLHDAQGAVQYPGSWLTLDVYMPMSKEGRIEPGDYNVTENSGAAGTITVGYYQDYGGNIKVAQKSYITNYESEQTGCIGAITEGSMTVSENAGVYTVDVDFVTLEGRHITGAVSAPVTVTDVPQAISTLTSDVTLDLAGATAFAYYEGDYYYNGTTDWLIYVDPTTGEDGFQMELITESVPATDGIPSGTYKVSASMTPEAGTYVAGSIWKDEWSGSTFLEGTMYRYNIVDGVAYGFAPATSGDFNITNNGDGTYEMSFAFTDDKGYIWSGAWSGPITIE